MGGFTKKHTDSPSLSQHGQRLWELPSTLEPSHLVFPFYNDLPLILARQPSKRIGNQGSLKGNNEWRGPLNGFAYVSYVHKDGALSIGQVDHDLIGDLIGVGMWGCEQGYFARREYSPGRPPQRISMHHIVSGRPPKGLVTDHINGWRNDNSLSNLRNATFSEQGFNTRKRQPAWSANSHHNRSGLRYLRFKIEIPISEDWTGDTTSFLSSMPSAEAIRDELNIHDPVKRSNV